MDIIDYDGQEWMRGLGFPGWTNAWTGIAITLMFGAGGAVGSWHFAHEHRDWSNILAIVFTLLTLAGSVLFGLLAAAVALFAIAGLHEWSTAYLIRAQAGAIIVEFRRLWGLVHVRREFATSAVNEVTTRMASASGDAIVTDISLRLDSGPVKVFRSCRPTEVEMLVIYLNAACGRHAGAGTAAQIGEHWAAMKATMTAKTGTVIAAPSPPPSSGAPPSP